MNLRHFRTFVWLRWRIRVNQMKRGGIGNAIILGFLAVSLAVAVIGLFIGSTAAGYFALSDVSPAVLMFVWDGYIVGFLFCWMIGLISEMQRADTLSLDKFLHLPVSLKGAFLINYFGSLAGVTMALFAPLAAGLILGLIAGRGPMMVLLIPPLLGFIFSVTAVTYLFQGWLASLMSNPRRRRTIIAMLTLSFVLIAQLPNLVNIFRPWGSRDVRAPNELFENVMALGVELQNKQITPAEYTRRHAELLEANKQNRETDNARTAGQAEEIAEYANLALPPGWLALGARGLADGNPLPMFLGTLGLTAIGLASLWRAYLTTLRLYTGHFTAGDKITTRAVNAPAGPKRPPRELWLLEKRLPRVPEQAAVIALAGFRSLTRAPEAKMAMLAPVIMAGIFGGIFIAQAPQIPSPFRPLIAFGAMAAMLFTLQQLVGNQFGYDRSGFRAFVLGPVPRREILLGKNLAAAPLAGGIAGVVVVALQCFLPMRIDHFLSCFFQFTTMFLSMCVVANLLSMYAPLAVAAGSAKAQNPKVLPIFMHMAAAMISPILYLPAIVPYGLEAALVEMEYLPAGVPLALALNMLTAALMVFVYGKLLTWQGRLLQAREQKILDAVVSKAE